MILLIEICHDLYADMADFIVVKNYNNPNDFFNVKYNKNSFSYRIQKKCISKDYGLGNIY
ncbi:protein of unknown function [Tepidibacter aestuarii]|nr:protein of unknown function [Tepidibacter aestuarii]